MSVLREQLPFQRIAKDRLLPVMNATAAVGSANSVRKVVQGYVSQVAKTVDQFMARYEGEEAALQSWSKRVKSACQRIDQGTSLPRQLVPYLCQFQRRDRKVDFCLTLEEMKAFAPAPPGLRRRSDL